MATLAELRQANDQIESQMREWKALRGERGEDPHDWTAFRLHVMAIGGADPGEAAPDEFAHWEGGAMGSGPATAGAAGAAPQLPNAAAAPSPGTSTEDAPESRTAFNPDGKAVSEVNSLSGSSPDAGGGDTSTWPTEVGTGSKTSVWPQKKVDDR
jgi:hypothetical protein